jgi:hypothetical protein
MFKTYKEQCDFEIWAFGRPDVFYSKELIPSWNRLHSDQLILGLDEDIEDKLEMLYEMYRTNTHSIQKEYRK